MKLTAIDLKYFCWEPVMDWQNLSAYTEIDVTAIEWLKNLLRRKHQEPYALNLRGLTLISSEVALALSSTRHLLDLSGLTRLEDCKGHVALVRKLVHQKNEYFKASAWLAFPRLQFLAPRIARSLARSNKHLELGLDEISVDAARALSKSQGRIVFPRLVNISLEAATALSAARGSLVLEAISIPSDTVAAVLANTVGVLELPSLSDLTDSPGNVALARKLASQGDVTLENLTRLSPLAAEQIASSHGTVFLNGLEILPGKTAAALSRTKARFIFFDKLSQLNDCEGHLALARTLAERTEFGDEVNLNGIKQLTEGVALVLARNRGYLALRGIESMPSAIARVLGLHAGRCLHLDGLVNLSGSFAAEFSHCHPKDGWEISFGDIQRFEVCELVFKLAVEHHINLGGFWVSEVPHAWIADQAGGAWFERIADLDLDTAAGLALSISKMTDSVALWFSSLDVRLEFPRLIEFPDSMGGLLLARKLALQDGPIIGNWRDIKRSLLLFEGIRPGKCSG